MEYLNLGKTEMLIFTHICFMSLERLLQPVVLVSPSVLKLGLSISIGQRLVACSTGMNSFQTQ